MTKENTTAEQINVATTNSPATSGMPLLNLSMTDKIYLAVHRKHADNLHYIYSLFCRMNNYGKYNMIPESDIAAFKDAAQADLYFNTLSQIQDVQSRGETHRSLSGFAGTYIADFYKKVR